MATSTNEGRPVFWAVLGCRVIGWLIVLFGATLLALSLTHGPDLYRTVVFGGLMLSGLAYVAIGHKLARGRAWAGICGIVLACLSLLFVGFIIFVEAALVSAFANGRVDGGMAATFTVEGLIVIALIWLTWRLWRATRAIQRNAAGAGHGFAVIPTAAPVEPESEA